MRFCQNSSPIALTNQEEYVFPACETAFCRLKELLVTTPVLAYPRFGSDTGFVLETDASYVGLGAVLSQQQDDGEVHPTYFLCLTVSGHP